MEKKILVLGDVMESISGKKIVEKENADRIIFLGDYVSTHGYELAHQQVSNMLEIFQLKENNPDGVVLLRGNHDMQHLGYHWAECSGWDMNVYEMMHPLRERYLRLTQWVYIDELLKTIFSHAGVSVEWMERIAGIESIYEINDLKPSVKFGFTPSDMSDYYGTSPTQPPTWIRPQVLVDYMPEGWTQVVGHTPMSVGVLNYAEAVAEIDEKKCPDLWCCDALGKNQYLVIENGIFIPKTLSDNEEK